MRNKAVFGIVRSQSETEAIIAELQSNGFAVSDISVLFPNKGESRDFAHTQGSKAPEGALAGGGIGALVGALIGLLCGLGAIAAPGLGALVAAGPILAVLSGGAVGAAFGAVTGGLLGLGFPEIQARPYEGKVRGGNILIAVHAEDPTQVQVAKRVFRARGAEDVAVTSEAHVPGPHFAMSLNRS